MVGEERRKEDEPAQHNKWQWIVPSNFPQLQPVKAPQNLLSVLNRGKAAFEDCFRP